MVTYCRPYPLATPAPPPPPTRKKRPPKLTLALLVWSLAAPAACPQRVLHPVLEEPHGCIGPTSGENRALGPWP